MRHGGRAAGPADPPDREGVEPGGSPVGGRWGARGRVSAIVTTYRQPRWLELALEGYAAQDDADYEVIVADDGSGAETADVVATVADRHPGLRLVHLWHEDRGFRKTEVLNRAIRVALGDWLVFSDGDCVPRADFVRTHRELARPRRFLSGGYVMLGPGPSQALGLDDVRTGRAFSAAWIRAYGQRLGRRRLRLLPDGPLPRLLDALTPTSPTFNGMGSSVARDDAFAVDGFDLDFRYGGLDREFGERLENAGVRGRQIRHRAVVLHLHHDRPYRDPDAIRRQHERRDEVRRSGRTKPGRGLGALVEPEFAEVEVRVERFGPAAAIASPRDAGGAS